MRYKIYAIVQIGLLLLYLVRPLFPYIEYSLHKDFIARNFCVKKDDPNNTCQGKCFLKKQLKKAQELLNLKERFAEKSKQISEGKEFYYTASLSSNFFNGFKILGTDCRILKIPGYTMSVFNPPE